MDILAGIIGLIKAIPIVDRWFQQLLVAYTNARIDSMSKENREALRKAFKEHDQRELEKAMGSVQAGQPSGNAGAVIVDQPPPNVGMPQP